VAGAVGSESGSRVRSGSGVMWQVDEELNKPDSWEGEAQAQGRSSRLHVDTARRTSTAAVTLLPDGAACKMGSASGSGSGSAVPVSVPVSVLAQSGACTALTDWDTQTTPSRRGARSAHGSFCQEGEEEDIDDEEDEEEDDDSDDDDDDDEEEEEEEEEIVEEVEDRIDSRDDEDEEEEDGYESGFSEGTHLRKLDAEGGGLMIGVEGLSPMDVYEAVTAKVCNCGAVQYSYGALHRRCSCSCLSAAT
jgi:hypothetical protein